MGAVKRKDLDSIIRLFQAFSNEDPEFYDGPAQSTIRDALYYLKDYKKIKEENDEK